jgi:hypothetical protein
MKKYTFIYEGRRSEELDRIELFCKDDQEAFELCKKLCALNPNCDNVYFLDIQETDFEKAMSLIESEKNKYWEEYLSMAETFGVEDSGTKHVSAQWAALSDIHEKLEQLINQ